MGYTIQYASVLSKPEDDKKGRTGRILAIALVAAALSIRLVFPESAIAMRKIFFPGANKHTQAAFSQMVDRICQGDPLMDAAQAFCRDMVENAQQPVS